MKQARLESLSDGIFAIAMTLLVLDLKIPHLQAFNYYSVFNSFMELLPYFMSYLTSFALLYVYWHAHHFIISIYAKNLTIKLSNINAIFLFFIGLVPFSSHILGLYHTSIFAVIFFSLHVGTIGLVLYYMRQYIKHSDSIHNVEITVTEDQHAQARILFPVFCALVAIPIAFVNPTMSLFFITVGILFNYSTSSTKMTFGILKMFYPRKYK